MELLLTAITFIGTYLITNVVYLAFARTAAPGTQETAKSRFWVGMTALCAALYFASPWPEYALLPLAASMFWFVGAAWVEMFRDINRATTVTSSIIIKLPEERQEAEAA